MTSVYLRPNENFESLIRRFKRSVERSGILAELKLKEYYEKPSQAKKRKAAAARKRELKRQEKTANFFKGNKNFKFSKDHTTKIPMPDKKQQAKQYEARQGSYSGNKSRTPSGSNYSSGRGGQSQGQSRPSRPYDKKPYQNNNYQQNRKPYNKG